MSIYDGIIINPQITVLHILPEIGMVVCKSFTNSWFIYQRSLKLPVKSSSTSITVLASSLLIQMLCTLMSKLKNPCRLSRRLGCWDNPSDPKTHHCIQWGINGRWGKVMFLILSAKSLIWIVMYEHEHGSIFILHCHPNLACIIHSLTSIDSCCSAEVPSGHPPLPAASLDNATPYHFLSLSQSQCLPCEMQETRRPHLPHSCQLVA